MMTPQTMAMITRVFPPRTRGAALGVWGSVAGVATIAGPLIGGLLVESAGWEWIFYVNVPVGVVAMWFAVRWLPSLDTHQRTFDVLGMVLSIAGMFLLIFGIQEGSTYDWGTIRGPITVWGVIGAGVVVLVAFGWLQVRRGDEALLPMRLFSNRTFLLANAAGGALGFAMVGIFFPLTIFLQSIVGLVPDPRGTGQPARLAHLGHARARGRAAVRQGAAEVDRRVRVRHVHRVGVLALVVDQRRGVPVAAAGADGDVRTGHRNGVLAAGQPRSLGAGPPYGRRGAGVFNTNRQVGSVIGSAAMVALLTSRLSHTILDAAQTASLQLPQQYRQPFLDAFSHVSAADFSGIGGSSASFPLPPGIPAGVATQVRQLAIGAVHDGFATAVGQSMLLAAVVFFLGLLATLAMRSVRIHHGPPAPRDDLPVALSTGVSEI